MTNLSIDAIAKDNTLINGKKADGVKVDGSAPAGTLLAVVWEGTRKFVTANAAGTWTAIFAASECPTSSGLGSISVNTVATDAGSKTLCTSKAVLFDTGNPAVSTINAMGSAEKVQTTGTTSGASVVGMTATNLLMDVLSGTGAKPAATQSSAPATSSTASALLHSSGPVATFVAGPADLAGYPAVDPAKAYAAQTAVPVLATGSIADRAITVDTLRLLTATDDVAGQVWTASATQATRISSAVRGGTAYGAIVSSSKVMGDLTLEGWFKNDLPTDAATQQLFHMGSMELFLRGGKLMTWSTAGGGDLAVTGFTPDKAWHHYALSTDGSGNWLVYVDGVQVQSRTGGKTPNDFSKWKIGVGNHITESKSFVGLMANVQIWDIQRTAADIGQDLLSVSNSNGNLKGSWLGGDLGDWDATIVHTDADLELRSGSTLADIDRTYVSNDRTQTLKGVFYGKLNSGDTLGIYDGGSLLGTVTPGGSGWSYTTPSLSEGTHTLTAQVRDADGKQKWVSKKYSVNIDASTADPYINTVSGDGRVNAAEKMAGVTIDGYAEPNSRVEVKWGTSTKTVTTDASGRWASLFSAAEVPADSPRTTVTARATDVAGNASSGAGTSTVAVDTTPPSMAMINAVSSDNRVNAGEKAAGVTVTGLADPNASVDVKWGSSTRTVSANTSGVWTTQFAATSIPADSANTAITAAAKDAAGNVSVAATRSVVVDTSAPAAPVINIVSTDNRINAKEKNTGVTVTGTAEANSNVEVKWGDSSKTVAANDSGVWTASFSAADIPADSARSVISARATDLAGNIGAFGTTTVAVDTVSPSVPVIYPVSGDDRVSTAEKSSGVTVNGTVEANCSVEVKWGTSTKSVTANAYGYWSVSFNSTEIPSDTASGALVVKSTDAAGNTSTVTRNVVIGTAPVINTVSYDDRINAAEKKAGVMVNGSAEANSNVDITWGTSTKSVKADAAGQWTYTFASADIPDDSSSTITVKAQSISSKTSESASRTVKIDTAAPVELAGKISDFVITNGTPLIKLIINNLSPGDRWEYSSDSGSTWKTLASDAWTAVPASALYNEGELQTRLIDAAGNYGPAAKIISNGRVLLADSYAKALEKTANIESDLSSHAQLIPYGQSWVSDDGKGTATSLKTFRDLYALNDLSSVYGQLDLMLQGTSSAFVNLGSTRDESIRFLSKLTSLGLTVYKDKVVDDLGVSNALAWEIYDASRATIKFWMQELSTKSQNIKNYIGNFNKDAAIAFAENFDASGSAPGGDYVRNPEDSVKDGLKAGHFLVVDNITIESVEVKPASGSGKFLVAKGSPYQGVAFHEFGANLYAGKTYMLSFRGLGSAENSASVKISVNGETVADGILLNSTEWKTQSIAWTAKKTVTNASIKLINTTTSATGNIFAIDDVQLISSGFSKIAETDQYQAASLFLGERISQATTDSSTKSKLLAIRKVYNDVLDLVKINDQDSSLISLAGTYSQSLDLVNALIAYTPSNSVKKDSSVWGLGVTRNEGGLYLASKESLNYWLGQVVNYQNTLLAGLQADGKLPASVDVGAADVKDLNVFLQVLPNTMIYTDSGTQKINSSTFFNPDTNKLLNPGLLYAKEQAVLTSANNSVKYYLDNSKTSGSRVETELFREGFTGTASSYSDEYGSSFPGVGNIAIRSQFLDWGLSLTGSADSDGKFLMVDGSTDSQKHFLKITSPKRLEKEVEYILRFQAATGTATQKAKLQLTVNGEDVGVPVEIDGTSWKQYVIRFMPTKAGDKISLKDLNTESSGNDFAIDDLRLSYTKINSDLLDNVNRVASLSAGFSSDKQNSLGQIEFLKEGFAGSSSTFADGYSSAFPGAGTYAVKGSFKDWGFDLSQASDGDGKFLIVDGSTDSSKKVIQLNSRVNLVENVDYIVKFSAASGSSAKLAKLQLTLNGKDVGTPVEVSGTAWHEYVINFTAPQSAVDQKLGLRDINTEVDGNDFALDDFRLNLSLASFKKKQSEKYFIARFFADDALGTGYIKGDGLQLGEYAILSSCSDHGLKTSVDADGDNRFGVYRATDSGTAIWQENNVVFRPGENYEFSVYAASNLTGDAGSKLSLEIDGKSVGSAVVGSGDWSRYVIKFVAPEKSEISTIKLTQSNAAAKGGYIALDGIRVERPVSAANASDGDISDMKKFISKINDFAGSTKTIDDYYKNIGDLLANVNLPSLILPVRSSELTELVIQDRWALMVRNYWFAYGFQAISERRIKDWMYDTEHHITAGDKPLTGPESAKKLLAIVGNFVAYDWYQATMYAFGQRLNNFKMTGNTNEDIKAGFQLAVNSIFAFGRLFIWGGGMYGAMSAAESDQWGKNGVKSFNGGLGFLIAAFGRLVSVGTTVVDIVNTAKMPDGAAKDAAIARATADMTAAIAGIIANSSLALTQFAIGAKDLSNAKFPGMSTTVFSPEFADKLTRNKATYQKIAAAAGAVQAVASIASAIAGLASSSASDEEKFAIGSELALNIFGGIATSKATSAISNEIAFLGSATKFSIAKLALGNFIGALNPIGIYSIVKAYEQAGKMRELANLIGRQDSYSGDDILADLLRQSADLEVGVYTFQFGVGVAGVILEYNAAIGGIAGGTAFGIELILGAASGIAEGIKQPLLESFADKAKERMLKESGGDLLKYFTNAHISKVADYVKSKEVVDFFKSTYTDLKVDRVIGVLTTHDDPLMRQLAAITKTTEFLSLSHTTALGFSGQELAEMKSIVDQDRRTIDISSSAASQHMMLMTPLTPVINYKKERIDAGKNSFASKIKVLGVEGWSISDGNSNSTVDLSTLVGFHLTSAADSIDTLNLSASDVWSVTTKINLGGGNDYLRVNVSKTVVDGGEGWDTVDYAAVSDRGRKSNLEFDYAENGDITVKKELLDQRIYASNISQENIQYGKRTERVDYREVKSISVNRFSEKIVDTLKNVEMVIGSLGPDKFYGNSKANVFEYGVNDYFDGGGDIDVVDFSVISQRSLLTAKNVASSNASEKAILAKIVADYNEFDNYDKWAGNVMLYMMGYEMPRDIPDVVQFPIYRAISDEFIKSFGRPYSRTPDLKGYIVVPPAWEDAYGDQNPTTDAIGILPAIDFGVTKLTDFLSSPSASGRKIFYSKSYDPNAVFDFSDLLSSYLITRTGTGVGDLHTGKIDKSDGSLASIFKHVNFDVLPYAYIPGVNMLHLTDDSFKNIEVFNLSENPEWVQGDVSGATYILNGGDDVFQTASNAGLTVDGGSGNNRIYTGGGKDAIISVMAKSSKEIEYVDAGAGDDVLKIGKSGSYFGGRGNDQFYLADAIDPVANKPYSLFDVKVTADGGDGTDSFLFAGDSSYDASSQTFVWTEVATRGNWNLKNMDETFLNVSLVGFEELQGHSGNDNFVALTVKSGVIGTEVSSAVQTYYGSTGVDVYNLNPRSINLLDFGLLKNADVNLVAGANAVYDFNHGNYLAANKSTSVVDFVSQVYLTPNSDRLDVTGGQFDLLAGGGSDSIYLKDFAGFADLGQGDDYARFGLNGLTVVGGEGSDQFVVDDTLTGTDFSGAFGGANVLMRAADADVLKINAPVGRGAELVVYVGSDGGTESTIDFGAALSSDIRWSRDEGDLRGLFNSSKNNAEQNLLEIVIKDARYFSEGKKDLGILFDVASGPASHSTVAKLYSEAPELGSEIFKTIQGINSSLKSYHSDGVISLKGLGTGGDYIDSLMYLAAYSDKAVI